MKGYVQVYTGDGKGKTTAALGVALRAAGAGYQVFIGQFIKAGEFSEIKALRRFDDLISIHQFGKGRFIKTTPTKEDIQSARIGLAKLKEAAGSGDYQLVIVDEGNVAVSCQLFPLSELVELIDGRHPDTELIITGRGAKPEVIDKADLVTEMRPIKHYYDQGVAARVGIEK